ncbi:T9SS type A sorting domain-containing protein [Taibaiella chishuiensis]|uniref:Putative secreted protein (Por secretion system target) n=1 Tax=Taibaiella chishuiensis TaxID=1434707 RepID=A0A2P8D4I7_9BACT|nr:T9SS type A sorting domain-containing protein [Taibaiella chishuiensis]PSK92134.1 putative secreted protein (Por secretion system target) [Taibaiella chishuiensis]
MKRRTTFYRSLVLLCLCLLAGTGTRAQPVPDNTEGRLWRLAKTWGYVRYYHPGVCTLNWDSLLYAQVPLVESATTNAAFNDHMLAMLEYAGQIPAAQATVAPVADTNLNLDLGWVSDTVFSPQVRAFLDTFKSRAGRNLALGCLHDDFNILVGIAKDTVKLPANYNDPAFRLTTAIHYWNLVNYLAPYRSLADYSWDKALFDAITPVKDALDEERFLFALAGMQARMDDSHGSFSNLLNRYWGTYNPGIAVKRVENKYVVMMIKDSTWGIQPGDVLTHINGSPVDSFVGAGKRLMAYSNDDGLYRNVSRILFKGMNNTLVNLELRNAAGQAYNKSLTRNMDLDTWTSWRQNLPQQAWRVLCNGYGYAHIGMLNEDNIDSMYDALKDRPGIVFDSRTYPNFSFLELYRRFMTGPVHSANIFEPDRFSPGLYRVKSDAGNYNFTNPQAYNGKIFFIVNEETQSASECMVQYMRRAPGVRVVGTQTAGADGNVNMFSLPGGNHTLYFTAIGYYYHDWYQCQRNGLRIDEVVPQTIAGIRAGKDEQLEYITGCTTGIKGGAGQAPEILVYPNPAGKLLYIDLQLRQATQLHGRVTDMTGRLLMTVDFGKAGAGRATHTLELGGLAPGLYLLQISTDTGQSQTLKISVQG